MASVRSIANQGSNAANEGATGKQVGCAQNRIRHAFGFRKQGNYRGRRPTSSSLFDRVYVALGLQHFHLALQTSDLRPHALNFFYHRHVEFANFARHRGKRLTQHVDSTFEYLGRSSTLQGPFVHALHVGFEDALPIPNVVRRLHNLVQLLTLRFHRTRDVRGGAGGTRSGRPGCDLGAT